MVLDDRLPAHATPAAASLGLWVVFDGELASDQLCDIVNGASTDKCEREAVHDNTRPVVFENAVVSQSERTSHRHRICW